MTMTGEVERELIRAVSAIGAELKAYKEQGSADSSRVSSELARLAATLEAREKAAEERADRHRVEMSSIHNWQLVHPTDPGAHADLRDAMSALATSFTETRDLVEANKRRIDLADERQKLWGIGYRYIAGFLGLMAAGLAVYAGLIQAFSK